MASGGYASRFVFLGDGAGSVQEAAIFFLKGLLPMVFFLMFNVVPDRLPPVRTHGECAVPLLPGELRTVQRFVHPLRRAPLEVAQQVGDAVGGFVAHEHMGMVFDPADRNRDRAQRPDEPAHVLVQTVAPVGGDPRLAVLGAEDGMDEQTQMSGWHDGLPPTGFTINNGRESKCSGWADDSFGSGGDNLPRAASGARNDLHNDSLSGGCGRPFRPGLATG